MILSSCTQVHPASSSLHIFLNLYFPVAYGSKPDVFFFFFIWLPFPPFPFFSICSFRGSLVYYWCAGPISWQTSQLASPARRRGTGRVSSGSLIEKLCTQSSEMRSDDDCDVDKSGGETKHRRRRWKQKKKTAEPY